MPSQPIGASSSLGYIDHGLSVIRNKA